MTDNSACAKITVGPYGRIVIPARMRRALGIDIGSKLIARVENGHLVLETREVVIARIHEQFQSVPRDVSLADELISERRAEATRV